MDRQDHAAEVEEPAGNSIGRFDAESDLAVLGVDAAGGPVGCRKGCEMKQATDQDGTAPVRWMPLSADADAAEDDWFRPDEPSELAAPEDGQAWLADSGVACGGSGLVAKLSATELAELIERVVDRDEVALAALYEQTSGLVYGLVLRITQRVALAEEVVEDTYWQVWRQAPRFDIARGSALAWLLAMARSRAIDALRSQARFEHDELDDECPADSAEPATPARQDLLDATREGARLHQALAELEALPRQLIALAFFRNLTHEEIAAQTHLALGTVKSHIRRALLQLRQQLGGERCGMFST
ncbi:MAG: sigma-70 family RNA polymerase sigma factor [Leptothrix sp. (in: b-proteobacteria)]